MQIKTLWDLWDRLNKHDWYYRMSDDPRAFRAGTADVKELNDGAELLGDEGRQLRADFGKHIFEKAPKPPRPPVVVLTDEEPSPGSTQALEAGCKCPIIDNHMGNGVPAADGSRKWWRAEDCPIHGTKKEN